MYAWSVVRMYLDGYVEMQQGEQYSMVTGRFKPIKGGIHNYTPRYDTLPAACVKAPKARPFITTGDFIDPTGTWGMMLICFKEL